MSEIEDFQTDAIQNEDSLSDAGRRLKSLSQWQWPIAFGPFVLLIVLAQVPIANALPVGLFVWLIIAAVIWVVVFKGYLLYLNYQK